MLIIAAHYLYQASFPSHSVTGCQALQERPTRRELRSSELLCSG